MALVSVIVPIYNVEKYLGRCLDSLVGQTLKDIEIICIDDGSTDASGRILDEYASRFPEIVAVHKENGGVSKARNAGIERAQGKWIGFVDSDDYVSPDMYRTLVDIAESNSCDVAQCSYNGQENKEGVFKGKDEIISAFIEETITNSSWCKIYASSLVKNMRFPEDLRFAEDFEFNSRVLSHAEGVAVILDALYFYAERGESETHRAINNDHLLGLRVYDYLKDECADNDCLCETIRKKELSASLRALDSIIGHGAIDKKYEKEFIDRIKSNKKYRKNNKYLSGLGKMRVCVVSAVPSLYIAIVKIYKKIRIEK